MNKAIMGLNNLEIQEKIYNPISCLTSTELRVQENRHLQPLQVEKLND